MSFRGDMLLIFGIREIRDRYDIFQAVVDGAMQRPSLRISANRNGGGTLYVVKYTGVLDGKPQSFTTLHEEREESFLSTILQQEWDVAYSLAKMYRRMRVMTFEDDRGVRPIAVGPLSLEVGNMEILQFEPGRRLKYSPAFRRAFGRSSRTRCGRYRSDACLTPVPQTPRS